MPEPHMFQALRKKRGLFVAITQRMEVLLPHSNRERGGMFVAITQRTDVLLPRSNRERRGIFFHSSLFYVSKNSDVAETADRGKAIPKHTPAHAVRWKRLVHSSKMFGSSQTQLEHEFEIASRKIWNLPCRSLFKDKSYLPQCGISHERRFCYAYRWKNIQYVYLTSVKYLQKFFWRLSTENHHHLTGWCLSWLQHFGRRRCNVKSHWPLLKANDKGATAPLSSMQQNYITTKLNKIVPVSFEYKYKTVDRSKFN